MSVSDSLLLKAAAAYLKMRMAGLLQAKAVVRSKKSRAHMAICCMISSVLTPS
jgi:hypothetical protein